MKQQSSDTIRQGAKRGATKRAMELLMEFAPLYHQKLSALFHGIKDPDFPCTKNQNRAILILKTRGRETLTRLGECLDMQKGSLTSLVDSLKGMGLIRRGPDPEDRRKAWLSLTHEGRSYVQRRYRAFEKALCELFDTVPESEIRRFNDCLGSVAETMKKL
jgi:DNA-binding MarR family transcriptional regulator